MKNETLRQQYRKVLEASVIATLFLAVICIRSVNWTKKHSDIDVPVFRPDLIDIQRTIYRERQSPPPKPVIPVVSLEENLLGDETIDPTDFFDTLIPVAPKAKEIPVSDKVSETAPFMSWDEEPVLIGGMAFLRKQLVYPEMARRAGMEGSARIKALISETGNVVETEILSENGNAGFGKAAENAVRLCKFRPARQRDRAVKVYWTIPVTFRLR